MEDYFIIERDSGVPDEQGRLTYPAKLREVSQELEEQIKDFLKVAKRVNASLIPEKRKRDILCDTVIVEALEKKLAQYPTTVLEDVALLKKADLSKRYRMAIEVRLGEKRLLQEAIALVRSTGEEQSEEDEDRTAKRIKI
jgi:SET domain-containing protein 6